MPETTSARVLIVEDEAHVRRIVSTHLGRAGHTVLLAENGAEALTLMRDGAPDVVVTDVMMPVMDGLTLLKKIRSDPALRGIYVIVLTGRDRARDVLEGFEYAADDYLTKPFRPAELVARVAAGIRLHQAIRRLRDANRGHREAFARHADMLGMLVQEMRQPLGIVSTYLSLLGRKRLPPETIREVCLHRIRSMEKLLDSFLDMKRVEEEYWRVAPTRFDPAPVLEEIVSLFLPVAEEQGVRFRSQVVPPAEVTLDRERLIDCTHTLLEHGLSSSEPESELEFRAQQDGDRFLLTVRSQRPREEMEDPSPEFDIEVPNADRSMALAILRTLVERMGGRLFAESRGPGQGTVCGISLPLTMEAGG